MYNSSACLYYFSVAHSGLVADCLIVLAFLFVYEKNEQLRVPKKEAHSNIFKFWKVLHHAELLLQHFASYDTKSLYSFVGSCV